MDIANMASTSNSYERTPKQYIRLSEQRKRVNSENTGESPDAKIIICSDSPVTPENPENRPWRNTRCGIQMLANDAPLIANPNY